MLKSNSSGSYERQTSKEDKLSSQVTDSHFSKRFLIGVREFHAFMTIASANRHWCICPCVMWGCFSAGLRLQTGNFQSGCWLHSCQQLWCDTLHHILNCLSMALKEDFTWHRPLNSCCINSSVLLSTHRHLQCSPRLINSLNSLFPWILCRCIF